MTRTGCRVREFEQEGGSGQAVASVAREMSSTVTDPSIQATEVSQTFLFSLSIFLLVYEFC